MNPNTRPYGSRLATSILQAYMNVDRSKLYLKGLSRLKSNRNQTTSIDLFETQPYVPNWIPCPRFIVWFGIIEFGAYEIHYYTQMNQISLLHGLPDRTSWIKTTIWCYHKNCRRLEREIDRKNNFSIVVTTHINAIFWALYTVMTMQNILRIRLKRWIIYR